MKKVLLIILMMISINGYAEIYDCPQDGHASYSDKPCPGATTASTSRATADLDEGVSAFENDNYTLAYEKLNPLAEGGNAMAQNIIGRMYANGEGVPQDFNKALDLFRKAARQNLPNAQNNLGTFYAAGIGVKQDYKEAISWFTKAANQGFVLSMDNLAGMYQKGLGVPPNPVEADMWRKKAGGLGIAKEKDLVEVQTVGHEEYERGLDRYYGGDFTGAAKWFLQAAEKGHPEAQLKLASLYELGQGVKKDESKSRYWAEKAKEGAHSMEDGRDRVIMIDTGSHQATPAASIDKDPLPGHAKKPTSRVITSSSRRHSSYPLRLPTAPPGALIDLAKGAKIEAVGVYEGGIGVVNINNENGNRLGGVQVRVRRSAKPLIIALSSYEPVNWILVPDPGATIAAVIVSGHYQSHVSGAGSARIIMAALKYAYKAEDNEYKELDLQTISLTGKPIEAFQGAYTGTNFTVGGN